MAPNPPRKGERSTGGSDALNNSQDIVDELPTIGPVASQGQLPPPHNRPITGNDHAHLGPPASQTPYHTPMTHRGGHQQQLPPHGAPAVSPMPGADNASTEYFPTLGQASSRSSMRSAASGFSERDSPALPRQPSIRLRRRGGSGSSQRSAAEQAAAQAAAAQFNGTDAQGRPRSISQPERSYAGGSRGTNVARHSKAVPQQHLPRLTEEGNRPTMQDLGISTEDQDQVAPLPNPVARSRSLEDAPGEVQQRSGLRRVSNFFRPRRTTMSSDVEQASGTDSGSIAPPQRTAEDDEYDAAIVDYLDTIDPEVQTLSALTNVQNSLFVPDLGSWLNRRPAYNLSAAQTREAGERVPRPSAPPPPASLDRPLPIPEGDEDGREPVGGRPDVQRTTTITSQLSETHYAALPHGETLSGWTEREKEELDDHVRHMLHSRRSKFKRGLKGFGQYVRRPLGFLVTLYATLITLFGLIWVLFIIGWISPSNEHRNKYILHIVDSVLVALFAIMGDGLIPWRIVDTWHICHIMHYARIVRKARAKALKKQKHLDEAHAELKKQTTPSDCQPGDEAGAASLKDFATSGEGAQAAGSNETEEQVWAPVVRRDSYTLANNIHVDVEDARSGMDAYEDTPLSPEQIKKLYHHQSKLAKSHSFYRPNETNTHYAFPLNYAIAVIFLLDFHSCLQISLGATTWGIDYRTRHAAITTVILVVSITVNITAGLVITAGGKKTRKQAVWNLMTRQELTGDAIKHLQAKHERRAKKVEQKVAAGEDPGHKQEKALKSQLEKEAKLQEESGDRSNPWA